MTYALLSPLGGDCPPDCYSSYWRLWQSYEDVYVLRLAVSGVPAIGSSSAALLWAKAVGQLQRQKELNVSGVCVEDRGGGYWTVEVVLTSATSGTVSYHGFGPVGWSYNEETLGARIADHPAIAAEWPEAKVAPVQWLELDGPPNAVSFWRAAPVLWAHYLSSPGGFGGPSAAYGRGEGAWRGTAASRQLQLQPKAVVPVGKKPNGGIGPPSASTVVAAGAAAAILWLALGSSRKATA